MRLNCVILATFVGGGCASQISVTGSALRTEEQASTAPRQADVDPTSATPQGHTSATQGRTPRPHPASPGPAPEATDGDDAAPADQTAPVVTTIVPAANATAIALGTTIVISFDDKVVAAALSWSLTKIPSGTPVAASATLSTSGTVLTITPTTDLDYGTTYELSYLGGLRDGSGNEVQSFTSRFTTIADAIPPGSFALTGPAADVDADDVNVTWQASADAVKYSLTYGDDSDCSDHTQAIDDIATTSQLLPTLSSGHYYVCVTALDASGNATSASNDGRTFYARAAPGTKIWEFSKHLGGSHTAASVVSEVAADGNGGYFALLRGYKMAETSLSGSSAISVALQHLPADTNGRWRKVIIPAAGNGLVVRLAVDTNNEMIYVMTHYEGSIRKFRFDGTEVTTGWPVALASSEQYFGLGVDSQGNVYAGGHVVASSNATVLRIRKFAANGAEVTSGWDKSIDGYPTHPCLKDEMVSLVVSPSDEVYTLSNTFDATSVTGACGGAMTPTGALRPWLKKFAADGSEITSGWNKRVTGVDGRTPTSLSVDANGYVYATGRQVSVGQQGWLKRYQANGTEVTTGWNKSLGDERPIRTMATTNHLYTVSYLSATTVIHKYQLSNGADVSGWPKTAAVNCFDFSIINCAGFADSDGALLVGGATDQETAIVRRYDASWNEVTTDWPFALSHQVNKSDSVADLHVMGEYLYALTVNSNDYTLSTTSKVVRLDHQGRLDGGWSLETNFAATSMAIGSDGSHYMAGLASTSSGPWLIKKYDDQGAEITGGWNKSISGPYGSGGYVAGLKIGPQDKIWVYGMVSSTGKVAPYSLRFDASGSTESAWTISHAAVNSYWGMGVTDLEITPSGEAYYAIDYSVSPMDAFTSDAQVRKFAANGTEASAPWPLQWGSGASTFTTIIDTLYASDDYLYIILSTPTGYQLKKVSSAGSEDTTLWNVAPPASSSPAKLVELRNGNILLASSESNVASATSGQDIVLYEYSPSGSLLGVWGSPLDVAGTSQTLSSLLVSPDGSVYVYGKGEEIDPDATNTAADSWIVKLEGPRAP